MDKTLCSVINIIRTAVWVVKGESGIDGQDGLGEGNCGRSTGSQPWDTFLYM